MINKKEVKAAYKAQGKKKNISALARQFGCSRTHIYRLVEKKKQAKQ